jgi:hypothetical protein
MSDAETAAATTPDSHDDHDGGHHEPTGEPLGPIDLAAWGYAIAGGAVGILVVLVLFVASGA